MVRKEKGDAERSLAEPIDFEAISKLLGNEPTADSAAEPKLCAEEIRHCLGD